MVKGIRSQSEIISSLLLILLVIAAAAIISTVTIGIVQNEMKKSDCLDVSGKVTITDTWTCYNNDLAAPEMQVQVHIDKIRDLISGYAISVGGASSKSYEIKDNITLTDVSMCNGSLTLYLANNSEERTYRILSADKPSSIQVYPILKDGRTCQLSDSSVEIQECISNSRKCA